MMAIIFSIFAILTAVWYNAIFIVLIQVGHASALGFSVGQDISVKYFGRDPASGKMRLSRKAIYSAASAAIKSLYDNS